jgi:hypothetical protein
MGMGLLAALGVATARAQPACPDNLLVNPGFENGATGRGRVAEVVATGWQAWYKSLPGVGGINYVPDYWPQERSETGPLRVLAGLWSMGQATVSSTHTAGLWQRVPVEPDTRVAVSANAYAWASDAADTGRSRPYGTYALALGVDPLGGTDPFAASVRWSPPITLTDVWVPLAVEVDSADTAVTIFTRGEALARREHNQSWWDMACVRVVGLAGEEPWTPTPSAPPTRPPRPGTPSATPDAAAAAVIVARLQAQATSLPNAGAGSDAAAILPPVTDDGAMASGDPGSDLGPVSSDPSGLLPPEPTTLERFGIAVVDHLGLLALGLAAFLGGLFVAVGWQRGGRR